MVVSDEVSEIQAIPLSEGYVGQRAESVNVQRSSRDLKSGRMGKAIYRAAFILDGTVG